MRHPLRWARGILLALAALLAVVPAHALSFHVEVPDFEQLEGQLRLRPQQKAQYYVAVHVTKRALMAVALVGLQIKERLGHEFSKARPDFSALYQAHEQLVEEARPHFRDAHREWARLYAMMDEQQIAIAKAFIRDKLHFFP